MRRRPRLASRVVSPTHLAQLRLSADAEPLAVVARLRASGLAVLPAWLGVSSLAAVLLEHEQVVRRATGGPVPVGRNGIGALSGRDLRRKQPALRAALDRAWVHEVARGYLGGRCSINERIVCTHERRELHPITAPHFDTLQSLKFLVYLLDTDERNGAFRYAPGTHLANAEAARRWRAEGGRVRNTPNVATEEEVAALEPIVGPAGTLVVFDSDGFHSGGMVQPGAERRVVRAQSYPVPRLHLHPRRLSTQWFRETVWNPLLRRAPVPSRPATSGNSRVRAAPGD
jgi:Phytanoyl-CoA dioxygenase (PhyH)